MTCGAEGLNWREINSRKARLGCGLLMLRAAGLGSEAAGRWKLGCCCSLSLLQFLFFEFLEAENKEKNHRDFGEGVGWNTNISGMLELCTILINWLGNFIDRKIIQV